MKLNNVFLIEKDTAKKEKNVNFSIHKKCVKDILENAGILNKAFAVSSNCTVKEAHLINIYSSKRYSVSCGNIYL